MSSSSKSNAVYVGRLTQKVSEDSIHSQFNKYGKIKDIDLKSGYAFVFYEDPSVLDEVVEKMNDKTFENLKLFVVKASDRHVPQYSEKGPQSSDKCFNCEKFGHWANECRNKSVNPPRRHRRSSRNNYSSGSSSSSSDRSNSRHKKNHSKKQEKKSYSRSDSSSKSRSKSRSHSKSSSDHHRKKNKHKSKQSSRSRSKSKSESKSHDKKKKEDKSKSKKQEDNSDQESNK